MRLKHTRLRPVAFVREQLRSPFTRHNSLRDLAHGWLSGYSSEQTVLLGRDRIAGEQHVPDAVKYRLTLSTNRHVWPILHDKLLFDGFMHGRLPITPLLRAIVNGQELSVRSDQRIETLLEALAPGDGVVIKPLRGGGGSGLVFLMRTEDGWRMNRERLSGIEARRRLAQHREYHGVYRIEPQHDTLAELFPRSANTLRIFTFVEEGQPPRIAACRLRIGSAHSWPVDNRNQGGLVAAVNLDNGVVQQVLARDGWHGTRAITHHPDSGVRIEGLTVPHWPMIRDTLLHFLENHRCFDYVGWDVLVKPEGFAVIEGNHNPNPLTMTLFEDLDAVPGLRSFFSRLGLLGARGRGRRPATARPR